MFEIDPSSFERGVPKTPDFYRVPAGHEDDEESLEEQASGEISPEKGIESLRGSLQELDEQLVREAREAGVEATPFQERRRDILDDARTICEGKADPHPLREKLSSTEVFLSYSHRGGEKGANRFVRKLERSLKRGGMHAWVDWQEGGVKKVDRSRMPRLEPRGLQEKGIGMSQNWKQAIDKAITPGSFGISLLDAAAVASLDNLKIIAEEEIEKIQKRGTLVFGLLDDADGSIRKAYSKIREEGRKSYDRVLSKLPAIDTIPQIPFSSEHGEDREALLDYAMQHLSHVDHPQEDSPEIIFTPSAAKKEVEPPHNAAGPEIGTPLGERLEQEIGEVTAKVRERAKRSKRPDAAKRLKIDLADLEEANIMALSLADPRRLAKELTLPKVFLPQAKGKTESAVCARSLRQGFEEIGVKVSDELFSEGKEEGYRFALLASKPSAEWEEGKSALTRAMGAARLGQGEIETISLDPGVFDRLRRLEEDYPNFAEVEVASRQAANLSKEDFQNPPEHIAAYIAMRLRLQEAAEWRH